MKKTMLMSTFLIISSGFLFCAEPQEKIIVQLSDDALELPISYIPVLGQSRVLRNVMKYDREELPIVISLDQFSKESFERVLVYLSILNNLKVENPTKADIKKRNGAIRTILKSTSDGDLAEIIKMADFLEIPLVLKNAVKAFARRLIDNNHLALMVQDPKYLQRFGFTSLIDYLLAQEIVKQSPWYENIMKLGSRFDVKSMKKKGANGELVKMPIYSFAITHDWMQAAIATYLQAFTAKLPEFIFRELRPDVDGNDDDLVGLHFDELLFNAAGTMIATIDYRNEKIIIWDAPTAKKLKVLRGYRVAFSPDNNLIAVIAHDNSVSIWDLAQGEFGELIKTFTIPAGYAQSLHFSPDNNLLIISLPSQVSLFDWQIGKEIRTIKERGESRVSLLSPDGKKVAAGFGHDVLIWDLAAGSLLRTLKGHTERIFSAAFSHDGSMMVTGSADRTVRIWNVASGKEIITFNQSEDTICTVAFNPDDINIVAASFDGSIRFYDIASTLRVAKGMRTLSLKQALLISLLFMHKYSGDYTDLDIKKYPHLQEIFDSLSDELQKLVKQYLQ